MVGPREVRLALALNGGVSLAVWMGGAAVELDAARRGHLGPEDLGDGRARRVYAALCEGLNRRLVLDVMAGSSAGGINAALLGAAITSGRRLHPDFIRERWVELGDLTQLMQPRNAPAPHSLLQGDLFHDSLEDAFKAVIGIGGREDRNSLCDGQAAVLDWRRDRLFADDRRSSVRHYEEQVPAIEITATDLAGEAVTVPDRWGTGLTTREFRVRFRFQNAGDFTVDRLADAARSSASFPVAFEPWWVRDEALKRAGLSVPRWMIDGGLLNNAPIKTALELIPTRRSDRPVKRMLCYVNPDPDSPPDGGFSTPSRDGTTADAVLARSLQILRSADFVDHVRAIRRAVQPEGMFDWREARLLFIPLDALELTASALVPTYNLARARASVEELTGLAPTPEALFGSRGAFGTMPWLRATASGLPYQRRDTDSAEEHRDEPLAVRWGLGLRAAQRALHLCVDALRRDRGSDERRGEEDALAPPDDEAAEIDALVERLERDYIRLLDDPDVSRAVERGEAPALAHAYAPYEDAAEKAMLAGAQSLWREIGEREESGLAQAFFGDERNGPPEPRTRSYREFIRRMHAIEIVRRAWDSSAPPIETAAPIGFVQLTPFTDSSILSAPGDISGPSSPEEKLCGLRWGHFSAFYKRSWRANDFMWGRLDGAVRAIDVLLDGTEATYPLADESTCARIAVGLFPKDADEATRWALREVIGWRAEGLTDDELRDELADRLRNPAGARRICSHLAQFEVLRDELDHLVAESKADHEEGAGTEPLRIDGDDLPERIQTLRTISLPSALGRDEPTEMTSDLALRTASSGLFVALSMISVIQKPFAKVLGVVRPALYALSGTVSKSQWSQVAVVLGFLAASSYIALRAIEVDASETIPASAVVKPPALLAGIALLIMAGLAFPPIVRARAGVAATANGLLIALILIAAGVTAVLPQPFGWTWLTGGLPVGAWLVGPQESTLPSWLEIAAFLILVGAVVGAWPGGRVLGPLKERLQSEGGRPWAGWWTFAALVLLAVATLCFTLPDLIDEVVSDPWEWQQTLVTCVLGGTLLIGFVFAFSADTRSRARPVRVWELEFETVEYVPALDRLTLERTTRSHDDLELPCANPLDRVLWNPRFGITAIEIRGAAARAAGEDAVAELDLDDSRHLEIPPTRLSAILEAERGAPVTRSNRAP